jgi:hypothetical protein
MTVPARCGAKTRAGSACQQVAGWGCGDLAGVPGARCKLHGGRSPSGRRAAQRSAAEQAVRTLGLPTDVDPHAALSEELARCNGAVLWLQDLIGRLEAGELKQRALSDGLMWERPSVWYEIYAAERAHLVRVAAAAIKAGVAERQVRLAEVQGEMIAKVLRGVFDEIGVIPSEDLPSVVRRHIAKVSGDVPAGSARLN